MSDQVVRVLLLDDDEVFSQILQRQLSAYCDEVVTATTLEQAREQMQSAQFSHALIDMNLQQATGLRLIEKLCRQHDPIRVVVLTGYASIATTVQAMRLGASNYLEKPATLIQILQALFGDEQAERADEDGDGFETMSLKRREWEHIQRSMEEHDGNISATARALGMHRRTLQRKLAKKPCKKPTHP